MIFKVAYEDRHYKQDWYALVHGHNSDTRIPGSFAIVYYGAVSVVNQYNKHSGTRWPQYEIFVLWIKFHWSLFPRSHLTMMQHWLLNGLATDMPQTITWPMMAQNTEAHIRHSASIYHIQCHCRPIMGFEHIPCLVNSILYQNYQAIFTSWRSHPHLTVPVQLKYTTTLRTYFIWNVDEDLSLGAKARLNIVAEIKFALRCI